MSKATILLRSTRGVDAGKSKRRTFGISYNISYNENTLIRIFQ